MLFGAAALGDLRIAEAEPSPSITRKELALRASLFAEGNPERYVGLDMLQGEDKQKPDARAQPPQQQSYASRPAVPPQNTSSPQQPPPNDNSTISVQQDGSVRVNTGNNNIDRRAEQTINRRVQNFIRSIWH